MNLPSIEYQDKLRRYVLQMRPVFKPNALFSDETENFVTPMEPEAGEVITIRFRTWKDNVDKVYFVSGSARMAMEFEKAEGNFDYFKIRVMMSEEPIHYFLKSMREKYIVSIIRRVFPKTSRTIMHLRSHRDSIHQTGQKAQ